MALAPFKARKNIKPGTAGSPSFRSLSVAGDDLLIPGRNGPLLLPNNDDEISTT